MFPGCRDGELFRTEGSHSYVRKGRFAARRSSRGGSFPSTSCCWLRSFRRDRMGSPPQHASALCLASLARRSTRPSRCARSSGSGRYGSYRSSDGSTKRRSRPPTVPTRCSIGRSSLSAMRRTSCRRRWPCSGNRLEWLLDRHRAHGRANGRAAPDAADAAAASCGSTETLLLLTKIDNGQFPESYGGRSGRGLVRRTGRSLRRDIRRSRGIACSVNPRRRRSSVRMNESLASALVANLVKNAFLHTAEGGVRSGSTLARPHAVGEPTTATAPLDGERIFERFYQGRPQGGFDRARTGAGQCRRDGTTDLRVALSFRVRPACFFRRVALISRKRSFFKRKGEKKRANIWK